MTLSDARIDALIAAGQAKTLFLAADLPETYDLSARRLSRDIRLVEMSGHDF